LSVKILLAGAQIYKKSYFKGLPSTNDCQGHSLQLLLLDRLPVVTTSPSWIITTFAVCVTACDLQKYSFRHHKYAF